MQSWYWRITDQLLSKILAWYHRLLPIQKILTFINIYRVILLKDPIMLIMFVIGRMIVILFHRLYIFFPISVFEGIKRLVMYVILLWYFRLHRITQRSHALTTWHKFLQLFISHLSSGWYLRWIALIIITTIGIISIRILKYRVTWGFLFFWLIEISWCTIVFISMSFSSSLT